MEMVGASTRLSAKGAKDDHRPTKGSSDLYLSLSKCKRRAYYMLAGEKTASISGFTWDTMLSGRQFEKELTSSAAAISPWLKRLSAVIGETMPCEAHQLCIANESPVLREQKWREAYEHGKAGVVFDREVSFVTTMVEKARSESKTLVLLQQPFFTVADGGVSEMRIPDVVLVWNNRVIVGDIKKTGWAEMGHGMQVVSCGRIVTQLFPKLELVRSGFILRCARGYAYDVTALNDHRMESLAHVKVETFPYEMIESHLDHASEELQRIRLNPCDTEAEIYFKKVCIECPYRETCFNKLSKTPREFELSRIPMDDATLHALMDRGVRTLAQFRSAEGEEILMDILGEQMAGIATAIRRRADVVAEFGFYLDWTPRPSWNEPILYSFQSKTKQCRWSFRGVTSETPDPSWFAGGGKALVAFTANEASRANRQLRDACKSSPDCDVIVLQDVIRERLHTLLPNYTLHGLAAFFASWKIEEKNFPMTILRQESAKGGADEDLAIADRQKDLRNVWQWIITAASRCPDPLLGM